MGYLPIEGCKLDPQCGTRWEAMEPIGKDPSVRFCPRCQSAVHWANDEVVAADLTRQGKCVALGFMEEI